MPNWCYQGLAIGGPFRDRQLLVEKWEVTENKRFCDWFPCPPELLVPPSRDETPEQEQARKQSNLEKFGYSGWYDWALANYGTKWGDVETQLHNVGSGKALAEFTFKSAWSPAELLIVKMSRRFPKLTFGLSYTEESDAFAGYVIIRNGHKHEEQDYGTEPPNEVMLDLENHDYDSYSEWRNDLQLEVDDDCMEAVKLHAKETAKADD
jgi:hypothetical protein